MTELWSSYHSLRHHYYKLILILKWTVYYSLLFGKHNLCLINLRSQLLSWWTSQGSDLGVVRPDVLYQQCAAHDHEVNKSEIGVRL